MHWLNIEMSTLENEAFGCAETCDVGTWLRLMRYCCVQENGGRIRGANDWDDRKWMFLCRLTKAEVMKKTDLWTLRSGEIIVHHFPDAHLKNAKRLRQQASTAARARWEKPKTAHSAKTMPTAIPQGMPSGMPETESGNAKDKIREDKIKKDKIKPEMPDGTDGQIPSSIENVIHVFTESGASEDSARDFFDHYAANGWKQGGRTPLASWRSAAGKWIRKWKKDHAGKNDSGALIFDPNRPNAHTGGIPIVA